MSAHTVFTTLRGRVRAKAISIAMERLDPAPEGVGIFEIEDDSGLWEVSGYFSQAPDRIQLALLAAAFHASEFVVSKLPEIDWVAHVRRELAPVEAGRFFVHGSHDSDKVPENREPLLVEAAMAFGTGHHGTTLGCLRAIDTLAATGVHCRRIADIGCGTAILAMAAARAWTNSTVLASDLDTVAVEAAEANVLANGLKGQVTCFVANGLNHPRLAAAAPFDLVVANILSKPLLALAVDIGNALAPRGRTILSGILAGQAERVIETYNEEGMELTHCENISDWITLRMRKIQRTGKRVDPFHARNARLKPNSQPIGIFSGASVRKNSCHDL